ncbi:MAG: signal transduction histidine kinase/CheY-like chemotaxis protein [Verrucomicrobiales bacterium]
MGAKTKILLALLLTGLVPVILLVSVAYVFTKNSVLDSQRADANDLARPVSAEIARSMQRVIDEIHKCRHNPLLLNSGAAESSKLIEIRRLLDSHPSLANLSLHGRGFTLSTGPTPPNPAPEDAFSAAQLGQFYLRVREEKLEGSASEEPVLVFYAPMQPTDGEPSGALLEITVPMRSFQSPIASAQLAHQGPVVLLDGANRILAHRDSQQLLSQMLLPNSAKSPLFVDDSGASHHVVEVPVSPGDRAFPETWRLVLLLPSETIDAVVSQSVSFLLLAGAGAVGLALLIGFGSAKRLTRTMNLARGFGEGTEWSELTARMPERGPAEFVGFAKIFNETFSRVETHQRELETLVERRESQLDESRSLHTILRSQLTKSIEMSDNGIAILAFEDSGLIEANSAFYDFCGMRPEETAGLDPNGLPEIFSRRFEDPGDFHQWWVEIQKNPESGVSKEWVAAEDEHGMVTVRAEPIPSPEGHVFAVIWAVELEASRGAAAPVASDRFEQITNLTNGIACEFNHILTSMIGNLALADADSSVDERETALLEAKRSAHRGAELVRGLLGYTQRSLLEIGPLTTDGVLDRAEQLLTVEAERKMGISLKIERPNPELTLLADPKRLVDVLRILSRNSIDAMEGGGVLTIRCTAILAGEDEPTRIDGCDYVCFEVEDTGTGIEPEIRDRIFEPFFTTRDGADGLGLSTAAGIIWQHGGWITCETTVGDGATMRFFLPSAKPHPRPRKPKPKKRLNAETVLVVDDDDTVRNLNEAILSRGGYETISASNAEDGLRLYRDYRDRISLILLDLNMPKVDGKEFFRRLRSEFGNVPVIIVSGYLFDYDAFEMDCGARPVAFVEKPYQADQLIGAVSEAIGAKAA